MKKRIPVSGHGIVQRDVMRLKMSIYSKAVYCLLMSYKGDKNACFPSLKTICEDLDISKNTVIKSISELEYNNLLIVQRKKKNNRDNSVNVYIPDLIYEEIEVGTPSSPGEPPSSPHEPPLVHQVNTKNNIYKNNIEESLISNPKSKDLGTQSELFVDDKPVSLYKFCIDVWLKKIHPGWTFGAVHGQKMKSIISKLKQVSKNSGFKDDDRSISDLFLKMMNNLPEYYKDKDLQVIDSKFNEIITEIKNGKQTSKNSNPYLYSDI